MMITDKPKLILRNRAEGKTTELVRLVREANSQGHLGLLVVCKYELGRSIKSQYPDIDFVTYGDVMDRNRGKFAGRCPYGGKIKLFFDDLECFMARMTQTVVAEGEIGAMSMTVNKDGVDLDYQTGIRYE